MSTLADINQVLQNQTAVLEEVATSSRNTNSSLDRFIREMKRTRDGDELEAEREKGRQQRIVAKPSTSQDSTNKGSGFSFPGRDILTGAGLATFGRGLLTKGLLKAIPIALATAFADDIEKWVTSETGSKFVGEAASRATIGGSFGLLLGRRFAFLGTVIGAIATNKNIEKFNELGSALKTRIDGFLETLGTFLESDAAKGVRDTFEKLGIDITAIKNGLPSMETVLTALSTGVGDGLTAITGFVEGGFDSKEFQENWISGVGLLAGVIAVFKPLRKMVFGLARFVTRSTLGKALVAVGLGTMAVSELIDGEFSESDLTAAIGLSLGAGAAAAYGAKALRNRRGAAAPRGGGGGGGTAAAGSAIGAPTTKSGRVLGEVFETKRGGRMKVMQNPKGGLYTQAVPKSTPLGVPGVKWWSKLPRLSGGLLGTAAGGALITAIDGYFISQIMNDDSLSKEEKIKRAGYILAGTIGSLGGLGVGTLVGGPLGGFIGSVAGSFLGDTSLGQSLGEGLMKWILGGDNSTPDGLRGDRRRRRNGSYDISPSSFDESFTPAPVSRPNISSGVAEGTYTMTAQQQAMSHRSASGNNIGQIGDNTTNNVSNSQPIMLNSGVVFDPNDMVLQ